MFGDITGELSDFDFILELTLEARIHDLALAGLEAIDNVGDRTSVIGHGEKNQLLIDEIRDRDCRYVVIHVRAGLELAQPFFTFIGLFLVESHINHSALGVRARSELLAMKLHV